MEGRMNFFFALTLVLLPMVGICADAVTASPKPSAAAPSLKMAKHFLDEGRLDEAVAIYEALGPQKAAKSEGWRLNNWGLALLRKDKAGDATPVLEKAVSADSKNFTAWANLAAAYEKIGDKVKAADTFRRALELLRSENAALGSGKRKKDVEAMVNAGPVSRAAEALVESPSTLSGAALAAALKDANSMMDAGKFLEAADAYAKIGITTPAKREGWRLNNWGLALIRLGDFKQALPRLKKSVEAFPDNPKAWNNLGVACENLGLNEEAGEAYARAAGSSTEADKDSAKIELNRTKLDFNAEKKKWEASR